MIHDKQHSLELAAGREKMAQIMFTHVSICKNNKIK
jgi:hypothetical protein